MYISLQYKNDSLHERVGTQVSVRQFIVVKGSIENKLKRVLNFNVSLRKEEKTFIPTTHASVEKSVGLACNTEDERRAHQVLYLSLIHI